MLRGMLDWLRMADYYAAKDQGTLEIIKRLSRRNVSTQNGWFLDDEGLKDLSARGDKAVAALKKVARQ